MKRERCASPTRALKAMPVPTTSEEEWQQF
jgi:hypothetical protein